MHNKPHTVKNTRTFALAWSSMLFFFLGPVGLAPDDWNILCDSVKWLPYLFVAIKQRYAA